MKLHITCSTNAVTQIFYGTDSIRFYVTLLILHRFIHFWFDQTKRKLLNLKSFTFDL